MYGISAVRVFMNDAVRLEIDQGTAPIYVTVPEPIALDSRLSREWMNVTQIFF
jgi:hypothetical protein